MKRGEIAHLVSRGAFWLALEKAVALLSGTLYFALLLRWMGPTKYGTITLALSFAGLATVATGNVEVFLERFAAEYQARGRMRTLRHAHAWALLIKTALGLVAGGLLVALAPWIARQFQAAPLATLLPILVPTVIFDGFYVTSRAVLYGLQQFRGLCALSIAFHLAKTAMVGALWGAYQGIVQLAIALAVLSVVQGVALTIYEMWLLRDARDEGEEPPPRGAQLARTMVGYSAPLLGARVAFLSGQNLSKIVLGKLADVAHVGYFAFAFQTVERFVELVHTLPSSLLPSLTQLVARGEHDRLRWVFDQSFRLIQVIACALAFFLFAFAPEVTRWVGSPMFEPAVPLLRIMALVPIARTAQQPLTMLFQALRRPGIVLGLALVKFAVEFGGYLVLVPALGLAGAGWSNLSGATASFAVALVALARLMPDGAGARAGVVGRSLGLLVPLLALVLVIEGTLPGMWSLVARAALVPIGALGVFALGLVNRYDLEKLSSIPLGVGWRGRMRDSAVAAADRLARAVTPRRA